MDHKIDIILATFNDESTIARSVRSILKQSYSNFNLYIINDGSTDSTLNIIKKFSQVDERVKIFDNKQNFGLPYSLNRGVKLCKSKYIARADGDDIWMHNKLEFQINYFMKNPDVKVLGTGAVIIEKNKSKKIKFFRKVIKKRNKGFKILINNYLFHSSSMFKSEILRENSYNEKLIRSQDEFLWIQLLDKGIEIHNLQLPLIIYNFEFKSSFNSILNRFYTDLKLSIKYVSPSAFLFSFVILFKKYVVKFTQY